MQHYICPETQDFNASGRETVLMQIKAYFYINISLNCFQDL